MQATFYLHLQVSLIIETNFHQLLIILDINNYY